MTFKDLIDKTTVSWANKLIENKKDSLSKELSSVNTQELLPGMNFNVNDAINEFSRIKAQLPVLKTYADVFGFAKLNETDINSLLTKGMDPTKISQMFGGDLSSTPNIAALIAKVQLGGVYSIINYTKPLVTELLDKIGRDTNVKDINLDDINYLITKNIDKEVDEILTTDESTHLLDEVSDELKQLQDPKASWDKKENDQQIIGIFLGKLRDNFLNSPMQKAILTQGAPMNSLKVKTAMEIMSTMSILSAKVEFGSTLETEFLNQKNN